MRPRTLNRAFGPTLTAIATVTVMAACSSSGNTAATQAAPTQPTATPAATTRVSTPQEFVSKRYNFRVTLTQDWSDVDAIIDWNGETLGGIGSPAFATLADPTTRRTLMTAAAPVPAGMQLADWQAAMVRGTSPLCSESPSTEATTLGGEPALAWTAKCSDGYDVNKLAALHGQHGYMLYLPSAATNDDTEDRRIFDGIRQSFRYTN
jgi:hypothetical protein